MKKYKPIRTLKQVDEDNSKKWRNIAAWLFVIGFALLVIVCYTVKILTIIGLIHLLK